MPRSEDRDSLLSKFLLNRRRNRLSAEELQALEGAVDQVKKLPARQIIVNGGEEVTRSIYLVEGLMCRYVDDRDGRRQLVAVHVAGDFVDLHGFPLERLEHDVATLTAATVATFPRQALVDIMASHPHLARMLWFSTLLDAAMHREWIFRLGRLPARGRVAHFFCELAIRLRLVSLGDGPTFSLPITQTDIAEACGLTPVHVNRVLRQLRERKIMQFGGGVLNILDWALLKEAAEFDAAYLYIDASFN